MNLDITFCASDCRNYECKRMLSYSKLRAAEAQNKPISHDDLSVGCEDYVNQLRSQRRNQAPSGE